MDKNQAYQVLGLPPEAQSSEIERRYQEQYNLLITRIDNPVSPKLKAQHEANLSDLKAAYELLVGYRDLPSATPVAAPEVADVEAVDVAKSKPATRPKGPSKWQLQIPLLTAIFAITAAVYFGTEWNKIKKENGKLQHKIDHLQAYPATFQNGKFEIENNLNEAVEVIAYLGWSWNSETMKLEKGRLVNLTNNPLRISPGQTARPSQSEILFYQITYYVDGEDFPRVFSDVHGVDQVINFPED